MKTDEGTNPAQPSKPGQQGRQSVKPYVDKSGNPENQS
jgi:hypothetical protein